MKETTIIYAHPNKESFNHAILKKIEDALQDQDQPYTVLDLYHDQFNSVHSKEELQYFSEGKAVDPLVISYQQQLKKTSHLILIFPIWWYDLPAILKGFFDKVMLNQFSHINTPAGVKGLLTTIEKVTIITTSKSPTWYLKYFGGNVIKKGLIQSTLKTIGIRKSKWVNLDQIDKSSTQKRTKFLERLSRLVA